MKKMLSLSLALCLLLAALPLQTLAYAGDIWSASSESVRQSTLSSGSLALQNDYLRIIVRKDGTLSTTPAANSADPTDRQTPFCEFITYGTKHTTHPASLRLKSVKFVNQTPNGTTKAIKAEYDLTVDLSKLTVSGTTSVYYELVQLKENEASAESWGVLASVDNVKINEQDSEKFFQTLNTDVGVFWGYTLDGFTAMGHTNAADSPVIKMSHTVYDHDTDAVLSSETSVITSKVEDISTWQSFSQGGDWCYDYITEVYVDGYAWANPFVGLSEYYKRSPIKAYLPDTVSVTPASRPADTRVACVNDVGLRFNDDTTGENSQRFLWGFRNLVAGEDQVPTAPDAVDPAIYAKRLAAFSVNGGVTVEYVADDAALEALKKQYGAPIALLSGDYKSTNGASFEFTGGAAMLSSSVTATWGTGGKLVIHRDGTVEQSGVSLNAPSFKFYQPNNNNAKELEITLTQDGFTFGIDPNKNDAIVFVDIPYATVKLEEATADAKGNLVFGGEIGFQTVFEGAEFTLEKLGYGLNEKQEFKVNGVQAKGSFDTAKLMALELAKVEGEVNTFPGEERYAFSLELNAFDLFETEAELALERSTKDGSLIPDKLWFYVKANPGIPLIPPIPIGQLNGGGAGFQDLAATVNGNYFAIPPLKLRGALTGTYLHLIEGTGNVVLGPSEISLKATDVGIVGVGKAGQIIDSFGYSLKLNGQERDYKGTTYKGVYFGGSEELKLNLPNKTIDAIILDSGVELGAFGGVNAAKDTVYLGVGANGVVRGRVQIPSDIPVAGGFGANVGNINLVIGGQTTFPIKDVSVSEGMKQAFDKMDIYLGAMVGVNVKIVDVRVWVLIPNIVNTNFKRGGGWDVEYRWLRSLPEWNWADHGVEPLTRSAASNDSSEDVPMLLATQENSGVNSADIKVTAGTDETPYIVLAFDNGVTEEEIKNALTVAKGGRDITINWIANDGDINPNADINATTIGGMKKTEDDGKEYRMAILRLKESGTYSVRAGMLSFSDEKGFAIEPFESLSLTQSGNTLSGEVKHPEKNTTYVLRTYLGSAEGEATYLVDEQTVKAPDSISITVPQNGTLAPTGEYYVTSFLMTEKEFTLEDGTKKTALVSIDSQQFSAPISYTNTNQPDAPQNVTLEATGNEVMKASWGAVTGANGYRVTIYQQEGNDWKDTGFGYDLDAGTTSLDMALTVGGEETEDSKNLSAGETYKVGVSAYKETEDGAKYYSTESESSGVYLPEYTPLALTLSVNGTDCEADKNGVYHAYVGKGSNALTVTCNEADSIAVTRMDTDAALAPDASGSFAIPDFTGSLMFCVDGKKDNDVTSVFLLVNMDETPPVLTLSAPIFYADKDSGKYTVTGTADAGSEILYDGTEKIYADRTGAFAISGTLEDDNSGVLSLCAQDSAGNRSAHQIALVARQGSDDKPSSGSGSGSSSSSYPVNAPDKTEHGTVTVSPKNAKRGETVTITVKPDNGYVLETIAATDKNGSALKLTEQGDGNYTFTMPSGKVEVKATFVKDTSLLDPFRDVPDGAYYYDAVQWAVGQGITKGISETLFGPDQTCTRAQIVTFLWRAAGSPKSVSRNMSFTDVSVGSYYYDAVLWAIEQGITQGTSDTAFSPTASCTRAQAVTLLARALDGKAGSQAAFCDVPADSYYAGAVAWAVENGVTNGISEGLFGPESNCTRAQIVTFLWRAQNDSTQQ